MTSKSIEVNNQGEVKVVTPKVLAEELKLKPTEVRRLLRKRFDKQGKTWEWREDDPELQKVKSYLLKQIVAIEEDKEKKRKAKEEKAKQVIEEVNEEILEEIEVLATVPESEGYLNEGIATAEV